MNNWGERFINKVTCGDCLTLLKELPDNGVDLVVTDPPYNINKEFANDNLKIKEFKKFHKAYLKELKRIIKPHKPILIFFNNGENSQNVITLWTKEEWRKVLRNSNGFCYGFNKPPHFVGTSKLTLDHIHPLSKAEKDRIYTINDIQPLCPDCNSTKGIHI